MIEPTIIINGVTLAVGQAMTVRVAIANFAASLIEDGLGIDDHGRAMTAAYLANIREIGSLMRGGAEPSIAGTP